MTLRYVMLTKYEGDYDVLLGVYSSKDRAKQAAVKCAESMRAGGTNYSLEFHFYEADLDENPLEELPCEIQYMCRGSTTLERVSHESWHQTMTISGSLVTNASGGIVESQAKKAEEEASRP